MDLITSIFAPWLAPSLFAACFGLLAYTLLESLQEANKSYSNLYEEHTARQLEDVFLFIPPHRILEIARISAVIVFILFFLLAGHFKSVQGLLSGSVVGGIGALLTLNAPRLILDILRARRLNRFNEQLVDALLSMSNALKAGFSILQAFESVTKEERDPIAQEFGVFLHEIRVGVRFEDALTNLESRVQSEDLTLMIRAIEIARQTGGNLTEVFDKIAETIRERLRIQGRIRSLTSQGRMQAVVVGSMPVLLLLALAMLDPRMIHEFISSVPGVALLILVVILEIMGALVIRKIIRIDI